MDRIKELSYAIEHLAKDIECMEEQSGRKYEISNLLSLVAEAIRTEIETDEKTTSR